MNIRLPRSTWRKPSPPSFDELAGSEAVRLFVVRSRSVKPEFALTGENGPVIADICRRLDGLPLAIELAAARPVLPPALLRRLAHALPLLTGGGRELPAHQQTMRTTIAWSYDLLSPPEQRFFRCLAVFMGGFTLDAFEEVCGPLASPELDAIDALTSLVDMSLVRAVDAADGVPRYVMLETIREFAEERLAESDEAASAHLRHVDWCLGFAGDAPSPLGEVAQSPGILRLEAEHANFRAALNWLDASNNTSTLMKLATRLGYFWYLAGQEPEGLDWLNRALASSREEASPDHITALIQAGHLAQTLKKPTARVYLEKGRSLAQASGNVGLDAHATVILGILAEDSGDYEEAEALMNRSQDLAQQAELEWAQMAARYHLGIIAYGRGDLEYARATLEAVRAEALMIHDLLIATWSLPYLALIECAVGDLPHAASLLHDAHTTSRVSGLRQGDTNLLGAVAVLAAAHEDWLAVARLLGAAAADSHDVPFSLPERIAFARAEASARQQMGPEGYAAAWNEGRRLRRDGIAAEIERVLSIAEEAPIAETVSQDPSALTSREQNVLRLLVDGRSNREIAETLFISPRTATTHVSHILSKFGVETRAAAVTYAFQHGLV